MAPSPAPRSWAPIPSDRGPTVLTDPDPGTTVDVMGIMSIIRRSLGWQSRQLEPHQFVASMAMTPPTSRIATVGEPLVISSTRCHREDWGRPSSDPIHHIPEEAT